MDKNYRFATNLYCITAEELSMGRSNIEVVQQMIAAGVTIIQYREKDKKMKEKYKECCMIRDMTREAGVTFIVNDDIDLAMIVQADGVHIGQDDLPIEKVRQLVGDKMIIGISTHCPQEAQQAVLSGADYIGVGPIFKTATKKDVCAPVGFDYLDYVAKNIDLPFVAIGGIKMDNIPEVMKWGTQCIAIVSEITTAPDIAGTISRIQQIIKKNIVEEK